MKSRIVLAIAGFLFLSACGVTTTTGLTPSERELAAKAKLQELVDSEDRNIRAHNSGLLQGFCLMHFTQSREIDDLCSMRKKTSDERQ